jgi:hypothetical protein
MMIPYHNCYKTINGTSCFFTLTLIVEGHTKNGITIYDATEVNFQQKLFFDEPKSII